MTDTREEISCRLSSIVGLEVSVVSHATDMLTLHFGPIRHYVTRRGTPLDGGAWALHIQCDWQLENAGVVFASRADFSSDDAIRRTTNRMRQLLIESGRVIVNGISAGTSGGATIFLSTGARIVLTSDGVADEEDWRFFAPESEAKHFVIEGGKVDPWSLS
ncbi:hypothetical protein ACFQ3P_37010 [Paraburkholderia sabiae]|uniref:Uncharacterized protein n=1 Tax=Paraburkholderia sabiae TaxID=273251 RepID=A0ABU9QNJ3_9BURK|nr:hypothetical protein [Paraburkholderia sabiae]WJZ73134.1 hypothetical protein QEN71_23740 [Paraburkholderia sabiae]CAD6562095.1 hypothetical protein LMG24235_07539 [Paraburkholderia sabiae]